MVWITPPYLVRRLSPKEIIWSIDNPDKKIHLTFDDGPLPEITNELLSLLDDFGAKATFFCQGRQLEKHPEFIEKFIRKGHSIGNHTYSHINAWKSNPIDFRNDVLQFQKIYPSRLFRPPYGNIPFCDYKYFAHNYSIIMWSLMSYDFDERITTEKIIKLFKSCTRTGYIWVFHDNEKAGKKAIQTLPVLLEYFTSKGFTFDALPG